ncbi:MAG TPA: hypothetical protein VGS10_07815 [Terracidiphilus sp.]|nr:hypothetical protein [Terracidiphilus sp.]
MNVEERLDRLSAIVEKLGERVDALAQTAELLAGMQVETERRMTQLVNVTNQIGTATETLIMIAHDHEQRITTLEV